MNDSGPPCRRCAERNLGCTLGKNLQSIIDEKTQYTDAVLQDLEALHSVLRDVTRKVGLPEPGTLQTSALRDAAGSPQPVDRTSALARQDDHGPSCDNSPKISPEDDTNLPHVPIHSLYALTKLRALRSPDAIQGQRGRAIDDFISRGAITQEDAERLFRLYRDRLDAFMYGVGCRYQTLEELRRKSSILTAATLTVAALHDPQADNIYGICSSEFRRLMERSMFDRRVDRDYLRAMCVASYWLSDMSWMLSGHAIRRAAECNLHNSHSRAIEEQSDEAADGARLWYILNICDQHLATLYGRPAIVHDDASMQSWEAFLQSPVSGDQDRRLLSQVALLSILGSIRELFGPDKGQPIPRAYLHQIAHFNKQLDHWINHWSMTLSGELAYTSIWTQSCGHRESEAKTILTLPDQYNHIGRFPRKGALLHYHFAKLHLYSHIFRGLSGDSPIPHYLLDCTAAAVSAATSTIDFILTDPDVAAGVVGMPSYLHCMTAFACMFLVKVAAKYGGGLIEPERVWDLTTSLVRHFRALPAGKWHLANLMAPGLERMAATLKLDRGPELQQLQDDMAMRQGALDAMPVGSAPEQQLVAPEGDLFFDYDMSFGLSPVFRFDPAALGLDAGPPGMQEFDYTMARPAT